jgi:hypothetical protein
MFCPYYKPGKNEELVCRGYVVVDRLRQGGKSISFRRSKKKIMAPATVEDLRKALCAACDFHENDCDFFQDRTSPSCGGFAVLAQLLESGGVTIDEVR